MCMKTENIRRSKMEKERTFEDIMNALMADENWEVPMEERGMYLTDFAWTINEM